LKGNFASRDDFIYQAQHPEKGMLLVGEVVTRHTGWTEGALESVNAVITKEWILKEC
jgi:monoamine oxidase